MKFFVTKSMFSGYYLDFEGEFPKGKIAAIKTAIEKWKVIFEFYEEHPDEYLNVRQVETCALCHLYIEAGCKRCPVYKRTGYIECKNTPIDQYYKNPNQRNAKREWNFLKSLLEK